MTKTLEIRVRPVTRWNITRYEHDSIENSGSCGSEGEFGSARDADKMAMAMKAQEPMARVVTSDGTIHDPIEQEFVITRVNTFELQNEVYFASTAQEAQARLDQLALTPGNTDWRAFSRPKNVYPAAPGEVKSVTYADGTTATGCAPLPECSPARQNAASAP